MMGDAPVPLVIDLDHTLIKTDTLLEQLTRIVFKQPGRIFTLAPVLLKSIAPFKRKVTRQADIDVTLFPFDEEILGLARQRAAAGGGVHLVTASDQAVADAVGAHLGLFRSVHGSDGVTNLKGARKAAFIQQMFPSGFAYAGDHTADLPIWTLSSEIIVARPAAGLLRKLRAAGLRPSHVTARPRVTLRTWVKALRVHQWAKNVIIAIPLFLSQQITHPATDLKVFAGWMAFNLIASSTYIINDLSDLAADRAHRVKRRRPFAAGLIAIPTAVLAAAALMLIGLAGAFGLNLRFGIAALTYVVCTLAYSLKLKQEPLIDVLVIGGLFTIRIAMGMILTAAPISLWLSTFTFVLFMSLALAKRNGELARAKIENAVPAGRGYVPADTAITTPLGIATGVTSVLIMILYMQLESMRTGLYQRPSTLFLIPVVVAAWILRIWMLSHRGTLNDDPVIFALRDRKSWLLGAAAGALWLLSIRR